MRALGRQILVECYGCDPSILDDSSSIREMMVRAAAEAGARIVTDAFHHFNPYGVSGVVVIAESHIAIHTWPEHGYAAVDIFTCGDTIDPWLIQEKICDRLAVQSVSNTEVRRGLLRAQSGSAALWQPRCTSACDPARHPCEPRS